MDLLEAVVQPGEDLGERDAAIAVDLPLDFHVLPQRLRAHGTTLVQENFDLAQDKGVALESGRVVRLKVPDVGPDVLCLFRRRQPAKSVVELADG